MMVKSKGFTVLVFTFLYGLYGLFNFSYLLHFSRLNTANASNRCTDLVGSLGSFSGEKGVSLKAFQRAFQGTFKEKKGIRAKHKKRQVKKTKVSTDLWNFTPLEQVVFK